MHVNDPNRIDPESLSFPRPAHRLTLQKSTTRSSSMYLLSFFIEYSLTHGSRKSTATPQSMGKPLNVTCSESLVTYHCYRKDGAS